MSGKQESSHKIIPAENAFAIAPSDVTALLGPTRGIYVGTTGNLRVLMTGGSVATFFDIAAGVIHPLQVIQVYLTGTTAINIVGLN